MAKLPARKPLKPRPKSSRNERRDNWYSLSGPIRWTRRNVLKSAANVAKERSRDKRKRRVVQNALARIQRRYRLARAFREWNRQGSMNNWKLATLRARLRDNTTTTPEERFNFRQPLRLNLPTKYFKQDL